MDRTKLARSAPPVAAFVTAITAVIAGAVVAGPHATPPSQRPRPLPLAASGPAGTTKDAAAPMTTTRAFLGKIVVPDSLLADQPTEGKAYTIDPRVETSVIATLASALGITGDVKTTAEGWTVGTGDRVLNVTNTGGLPWYTGPGDKGVVGIAVDVATAAPATIAPCPTPTAPNEVVHCDPPPPDATPEDQPGATPVPVPLPEPVAPSPAPQPSDDVARAVATKVLAAAGVTEPDLTLQPGFAGKDVVARPVVGGLPTSGYETSLTVDVHGDVVYGNGYLGRATYNATYPLLDPQAAADRTATKYLGGPVPLPAVETTPVPAPDRVATKVRLGLQFQPSWQPDGTAYLVPAWLLTFAESTWEEPVLALPDEYLATPPPPAYDPAGKPEPVPPGTPASADGSSGSGGTATTP